VLFLSKEEGVGDDFGLKITCENMLNFSGHQNMLGSDNWKFNPRAEGYVLLTHIPSS